jgi:AcrR family transcriptional regulator
MIAAPPAALPSLRSVARECGVSATAVYRHFASQSNLIRSVLVARFADFESTILGADETSASPEDRVRMIAHAYLTWGTENPGIYSLLFESADQLGDDYVIGDASSILMDRLAEMMASNSREGESAGDEAERFWSYLHGLTSLRLHKSGYPWRHDGHDEVETLLALFFSPTSATSTGST